MRILVANDLRSYREAIATALREMRPQFDVWEVDSEWLNREAARLRPDLVIGTNVSSVTRSRVFSWIELYPDCEPRSVLCIGDELRQIEDIQLSDLISIADQVERILRSTPRIARI